LVVAGIALALIVASTISIFARTRMDQSRPAAWTVTLLRDGQPRDSVAIERELPGNLSELFPTHADVGDRAHAFLVEKHTISHPGDNGPLTIDRMPSSERKIVEFLLLLPLAALLVCLFRNLIGLNSFGTFAPALLGLSFRDVHSIAGVGVVFGMLLIGWLLRRLLNRLHLLQAPRTALLLSLVVVMLLLFIFAWNTAGGNGASSVSLFPLVILTGMIERFWSMEEEDGAGASLRTLLSTLSLAACVWTMAAIPAVPRTMLRYPEMLGFVMAGQLLLGRYTGFRVLEMHRFRAMLNDA
jgi:hypothetical protein